LSVPVLNLFLSPKTTVSLVVILGAVLNVILLLQCYKQVEIKKIPYLLLGSIIGIPFGAYVLTVFSVQFLKILIGAITIGSASLLFLEINKRFKREHLASILVGLISGVLKGSVGMPGPPIVLFGLNQGWEKERFRATIIAYFTMLSFVTIGTFLKFKLFTEFIAMLGIIGLPMLLLGSWVGIKLKGKVSAAGFHKIILALITIAGVLGIITAF